MAYPSLFPPKWENKLTCDKTQGLPIHGHILRPRPLFPRPDPRPRSPPLPRPRNHHPGELYPLGPMAGRSNRDRATDVRHQGKRQCELSEFRLEYGV